MINKMNKKQMQFIKSFVITCFLLGGLITFVHAQTVPAGKTYNVRDFGATGNGQTLDTDPINKAITTAALAGGGTDAVEVERDQSESQR